MSINENAVDEVIGHRLALLRFEGGAVRDLLAVYDGALEDVVAELARAEAAVARGSLNQARVDRLREVAAQLSDRVRELNRIARDGLTQRLEEAADAEVAFQAGALSRAVGITFTGIPDAAVLEALSSPLGPSWVTRLSTDLYEATSSLQGVLGRALAQGASMPEVARQIRTATGLVETYRGRMIAIARTEIQRVSNDVAIAGYEANADVLSGVQWLSTLDSRTCPVCAPKHGTVYPLVAGRVTRLDRRPPLHPRCRCFLAPVVKEWDEIVSVGKEAMRDQDLYDGQAANETTFDAWLRRQPAATADDILGPTRAALWRSGTPLDRFSDGRRVLSLGELRAQTVSVGG